MINGRSAEVSVGGTHDELALLVQSWAFVRRRSPRSCSPAGDPVSKGTLCSVERSVGWPGQEIPIAEYSGHCCRIGAASAATQAQIPDSVMQAISRCSSRSFSALHPRFSRRSALTRCRMQQHYVGGIVCAPIWLINFLEGVCLGGVGVRTSSHSLGRGGA